MRSTLADVSVAFPVRLLQDSMRVASKNDVDLRSSSGEFDVPLMANVGDRAK